MPFLLKIAVLLGVFLALVIFRNRISRVLGRIPLPRFALYFIVALPLEILEEQINCIASWCGTVVIPPTIPYLLIEMLILYGIWKWLKIRSVWPLLIGYCLFGVAWEYFIGGLHDVALPPLYYAFFFVWVAFSYAFISYTPFRILTRRTDG